MRDVWTRGCVDVWVCARVMCAVCGVMCCVPCVMCDECCWMRDV